MKKRYKNKFQIALLNTTKFCGLALIGLRTEIIFAKDKPIESDSTRPYISSQKEQNLKASSQNLQKDSTKTDQEEPIWEERFYIFTTTSNKIKDKLDDYLSSSEHPRFVILDEHGEPTYPNRVHKNLPWLCHCYALPPKLFSKIASMWICYNMVQHFSKIEDILKERIWYVRQALQAELNDNSILILQNQADTRVEFTVDVKHGRVFECLADDYGRFQANQQSLKIDQPSQVAYCIKVPNAIYEKLG
ncbi:MAG: hypothetical protein LBB11_02465, partial [Puniceicoccales bacterium]|nr:hypothetical protein [Puniceicoccales bacterium]